MNIQKHIEELNNMSAADLAAIEAIPAEQVKEAQANVDRQLLADNLFQYGTLQAEKDFANFVSEGDLSKVASAEEIAAHDETEATVRGNIEMLLTELGVEDTEEEHELAKEAQATAGFIFAGYADAIEKIAEQNKESAHAFIEKMKSHAGKAGEALKGAAGKAGAHVMNHKKKYAGGAAATAALGAGAHFYKKHKKGHEKKAGDLTVGELHEELAKVAQVEAGLDKLAAFAAAKGQALREKLVG